MPPILNYNIFRELGEKEDVLDEADRDGIGGVLPLKSNHANGYLYQIGFAIRKNIAKIDYEGRRVVVVTDASVSVHTTHGSGKDILLDDEEKEQLYNWYRGGVVIFFMIGFQTGHHKQSRALGKAKRLNHLFNSKKEHAGLLRASIGCWKWYDILHGNYDRTSQRAADRCYERLTTNILKDIRTMLGETAQSSILEKVPMQDFKIRNICNYQSLFVIEGYMRKYATLLLCNNVKLVLLYTFKIRRFIANSDKVDWYKISPEWNMDPLIGKLANGEVVTREECKNLIEELEKSDAVATLPSPDDLPPFRTWKWK